MTEASRVQKLLTEQNAEIERLKNSIEKLEAALFNIYVAPNDTPFIKAQIDAVLDINEYRQALKENNDPST
jgi:hypothetical protein